MSLTLSQLVTFNPVAVTPETPLEQLLDQQQSLELRHWPVVNAAREVIGVVTESDLVRHTQANMLAAAFGGDGFDEWRPTTIADIMSSRVITIELSASAQDAIRLLLDHNIHSLPITDGGRLRAIVTTTDFLREFSFGELESARGLVARRAVEITDTIEATSTFDETLMAMLASANRFVAVVRGGCPLGVVSHRELSKARCREIASEMASGEKPPASVASLVADALIFRPGIKLAEAAQAFLEHGREAGLVVNQANRMVGMLTVNEILKAML
jgi:CBS domain-containing protein